MTKVFLLAVWCLAAAVGSLLLSACDLGSQGQADSGSAELVASENTLPGEQGEAFADIVTTAHDLEEVWRRFRLSGAEPSVDFDSTALLFVGVGESSGCPAEFGGMTVDGDVVFMEVSQDRSSVCPDDFVPKTFVLAVDKRQLPEGRLVIDLGEWSRGLFVLTSTPQDEPPLGAMREDPGVTVTAEPSRVRAGERLEVLVSSHSDSRVPGAMWATTLEVWQRQRWIPVDGHPVDAEHPAIQLRGDVTVEPDGRSLVAAVDTADLEPGWYGVGAISGFLDVRATFEVRR